MNFKMAMNTVTIKPTPFRQKLKLISEERFEGIGLWMDEIQTYLKGDSKGSVKELLEQYALIPVEIQLIQKWQYLSGSDKTRAFEEARQFFAKVKELDIHCPVVALTSWEVGEKNNAIRDFRQLCRLADEFSLDVVFEFSGSAKQINNVKIGWEIVEGAGCSNGGLLIDTFHFVKGGSSIDDLKRVPMEKVLLVHINDVKPLNLPIKEQSLRFRFFPGEGEAPLKEIVECLRENGYKGFYCCEIFNENYWLQDPQTVLRRSKKSMEDLFYLASRHR